MKVSHVSHLKIISPRASSLLRLSLTNTSEQDRLTMSQHHHRPEVKKDDTSPCNSSTVQTSGCADGRIRVAVVGSCSRGRSSTVASLIGATPAEGQQCNAFHEYQRSTSDQSKPFRVKVFYLGEEEMKHGIRENCRILMDRSEWDGAASPRFYKTELILASLLQSVDDNDPLDLFRTQFRILATSSSPEQVVDTITEQVLSRLRHAPVSPYKPETLQWNAYTLEKAVCWSSNDDDISCLATSWPFVYKIQVHCKTLDDQNLIILDCPNNVAHLERFTETINSNIRRCDIEVVTEDYKDVWYDRFSEFYRPDSATEHLHVLTGDVEDGDRAGCDIEPGLEDRMGLDKADKAQILETVEILRDAEEAEDACYEEYGDASGSNSAAVPHWLDGMDYWGVIVGRATANKKKVHIAMRAKQVVYKAQRFEQSSVRVIRIFSKAYGKIGRGIDAGTTRPVIHAGVEWNVENTGVPALLRQLHEKIIAVQRKSPATHVAESLGM